MKIKMIASDVDRTLLRTNGTLAPETVDAVRAAQAAGILFVICTGRFPEYGSLLLRNEGIICPIIGFNGGVLWDGETKKVMKDHPLPHEDALRVQEILQHFDTPYYVFGNALLASSDINHLHPSQRYYGDQMINDYGMRYTHGFQAIQEAVEQPVNKFLIYHFKDNENREAIISEISRLTGVAITSSGPDNIEVIPKGIDKGTGVTEMAALHGIPLENVMTAGDYENDISMLRAAGWGVAMGNALEHVKAQANCVTTLNDENGLAKAIWKYALGVEK